MKLQLNLCKNLSKSKESMPVTNSGYGAGKPEKFTQKVVHLIRFQNMEKLKSMLKNSF